MTPPPRDMLVQPIYIDYGDAARDIAWCNGESAGANAARPFARKGKLPVTLRFLEPFDPKSFTHRKAIAAEAQKKIAAFPPPTARAAATVQMSILITKNQKHLT